MNFSALVPQLNRDGKLVIAASAVRSLDYSFLSVFLGVYLSLLNYSAFQAGLVFSAIMAGGALSNTIAGWKGDTIGRRRMLLAMAVLTVIGGALFPISENVAFLMVVGVFAMTTTSGGDRTAFISLDTAILVETCEPAQRTLVFSWYNIASIAAKALGAMLIVIPAILQSQFGMEEIASFKVMFGMYAIIAIGGIVFYAGLSREVEPPKFRESKVSKSEASRHRKAIIQLTSLFFLDALGGGFIVRSFISFWFVSKFGVDLFSLSGIFVAGQLLNVISIALATPVANRIGLIATMSFTQVIANLMFFAMAFSTNMWMAVFFFLAHEISNDMDVPTRQSYTMAIVPPESRTAMATLNNLGRNIAQTISPAIAGLIAQTIFLGAPFLVGSSIKLVYNGLLYMMFRGVKSPDEKNEKGTEVTGEKANA